MPLDSFHLPQEVLLASRDINQQYLKIMLTDQNNFHQLEVADRVSETQLQVGENSNK